MSFWFSTFYENISVGEGDSSVSKVFAMQARRPDLESESPM